MAGRAAAACCYLPIPGFACLAVLAAPRDRLVRYHAWQGGVLVAAILVWVAAWGMLANGLGEGPLQDAAGMVAGIGILAGLVGLVAGVTGALRGRYSRVRPVWDALQWAGR